VFHSFFIPKTKPATFSINVLAGFYISRSHTRTKKHFVHIAMLLMIRNKERFFKNAIVKLMNVSRKKLWVLCETLLLTCLAIHSKTFGKIVCQNPRMVFQYIFAIIILNRFSEVNAWLQKSSETQYHWRYWFIQCRKIWKIWTLFSSKVTRQGYFSFVKNLLQKYLHKLLEVQCAYLVLFRKQSYFVTYNFESIVCLPGHFYWMHVSKGK